MRNEIEDILDNFDFAKVKIVMDALDWYWYNTIGVPEIADLRKHARSLLTDAGEQVMKNKELTAEVNRATGGFRAQAHRYLDEEKIYFRLSFEVSAWDNYE